MIFELSLYISKWATGIFVIIFLVGKGKKEVIHVYNIFFQTQHGVRELNHIMDSSSPAVFPTKPH